VFKVAHLGEPFQNCGRLYNILSQPKISLLTFSSTPRSVTVAAMAKARAAVDKKAHKKAGITAKDHKKTVKASINPTPISSKEILEKAVRFISCSCGCLINVLMQQAKGTASKPLTSKKKPEKVCVFILFLFLSSSLLPSPSLAQNIPF